jgi:RNA polymerase sigma factor (sigma-70 family)
MIMTHKNEDHNGSAPGRNWGGLPSLRQTNRLLSFDEERALAARVQAGDAEARETLVTANLRLVLKIAYRHKCSGATIDDLVQEGVLGLIRAAEIFNPQAHNVRFSTYASYWIRNFIARAIIKNRSLIRLPDYLSLLKSQFHRALVDLRNRSEPGPGAPGEPTPGAHPPGAGAHPQGAETHEVAARLRISLGQLKNLDRAMIERSSYYGIDDDGGLTSLEEIIADPRPPDRDLEHVEDLQVLHAALDRLPPFEAWVIRQRFGLHGDGQPGAAPSRRAGIPARREPGRPRSYLQISRACGLTVKRVRRAEEQALYKLRAELQAQFAEAG